MSDLDRRAALCMGWKMGDDGFYRVPANREVKWRTSIANWSPTTDANACRELLEEVKRRGLAQEFEVHPIVCRFPMLELDVLLAPLPLIVEAAVSVLESAGKERTG